MKNAASSPSDDMSLRSRLAALFAIRTSPENPASDLSNPSTWLWDALGSGKSSSGQNVNETTALALTTVYACVRVLAEGVASIPLNVYERLPKGGKDVANDHPNYELLHDRPNPDQTSFSWRETVMAHLGLRGNAFCEKEYTGRGTIKALWPIAPNRVLVKRVGGQKMFQISTGTRTELLSSDEILHIPGLGYDGLQGYSPIRIAAEAIGLGLAAQEHGARFFENGAEIGGILEHPGRLSPQAKTNLRESFEAKHRGTANAHRAFIAEEGMKWTQVGLSNRDSQYLETRKFQVSEIARVYRVPPHMIGDLERATFSNIEQQSIDFVVHTLRPWLVQIEQVLNWELFGDVKTSKFFCEFNVDGLLRGDSAARAAFYKDMVNTGIFSINDCRIKENMNPVEGGDERFIQGAMVPLSKIEALADAQIDAKKAPPALPAAAPAKDAPAPARATPRLHDACYRLYRQAAERCVTKYVKATRRMAAKGTDRSLTELRTAITGFFASEQMNARLAFHPATLALADVANVDAVAVTHHAAEIGTRLTNMLSAELLALPDAASITERLAQWESYRADEIAMEETMTVLALITRLTSVETAA